MSQDSVIQSSGIAPGAAAPHERGMIDLYVQRISLVRSQQVAERERALERIVVTQPFGRAFTAQPSYPPDPPETEVSRIAGLRRRLAGSSAPARKLATS